MRRFCLLFLALLLLVLVHAPARALESAPVTSPRATVTLVSDTDSIEAGMPFRVGLFIRLAPGWHTYWKNPGDAGVPPALTIENAETSAIAWPTPVRVAEGPVMTYAYTQPVLLPVTVTASPNVLRAHASWLVCKEICVPEEGDFSLTLPAGRPSPSPQMALFVAHDRAMPRPSPWPTTIAADGTLFAHATALAEAGVTDAWFIPDDPGCIQDDAAQPVSIRADGLILALKLAKEFAPAHGLSGLLVIRDRAGETALAIAATPGDATPGDATQGDATQGDAAPAKGEAAREAAGDALGEAPGGEEALGRVLVFAFLGGLILNLMPCVFPILAMKAVSLAQHREGAHSVAYLAGVLVTFLALAAILLVARSLGVAAGWGFQFSAPGFVAAMTWLLFAIGLNLSGVFEVSGAFAGIGGGLAGRSGIVGSFFTGLLAVLVATPCTAPFMGVAVAAGLAAPSYVTVLVFVMMGLGLAAPYVMIASVPMLAGLLPRPGAWMQVFRQALAFPMYAAAVWLLWVLGQEAGPDGVLATGVGLVLLGFAAWVLGLVQSLRLRARRLGTGLALLAVLAALAMLPAIQLLEGQSQMGQFQTGQRSDGQRQGMDAAGAPFGAEPFTAETLARLRAEGRPVFVNITAAWCVTCLVNERVALDTTAVHAVFARHHVAYLKGDWTRQDPALTAFLRQHRRDGVPLYIFYPADGGAPVVLGQILTEGDILGLFKAG